MAKIIGNIATTPMVTSDWNQNYETKADYIKNRTHYTENVLVCEYTAITDINEDPSFEGYMYELSEKLDINNIIIYINGKKNTSETPIDSSGNFYFGDMNIIFDYYADRNVIMFSNSIPKGTHIEIYQENIIKLSEKYIPDTVPKMTEYEKELICQYTYNSADYVEGWVGIGVNKKLEKDKISIYINGERVDDFYTEDNLSEKGSFWGMGDNYSIYFYYFFDEDIVTFYPTYNDGDVIEIYEENVIHLKDEDIPNAIARTQYVDRRIDATEDYIKQYTAEKLLIAEYTCSEEMAIIQLSRKLSANIEFYINDELTPISIMPDGEGNFTVCEVGESGIYYFFYNDTSKDISFYNSLPVGMTVSIYEIDPIIIKEDSIPDTIARVEYVDKNYTTTEVILCDYTAIYDSGDIMQENVTEEEQEAMFDTMHIKLSRPIANVNELKMYVNGESVDFYTETYNNGSEIAFGVPGNNEISFSYDGVKSISFHMVIPKGTQISLIENVKLLNEGYIPDAIARVDYVEEKIGDMETALDAIIAIQNELIGGNE